MKGYRKLRCRIVAAALSLLLALSGVLAIHPFSAAAQDDALPEGALISVGGKTVYEDSTISQVEALFGPPQLKTPSPFGGSAYTFYGEDYSDYLYLETNAQGEIAAYGSISEGFQTNVFSYGEEEDNLVRNSTQAVDDNDRIYGFVGYVSSHTGLRPAGYHQAIVENLDLYNIALCQHAVLMFNAVSQLYGYQTPMVYNQESYEHTLQMAANGSNVYRYATAVGKTGYLQGISWGNYTWDTYTYVNPLFFAREARRYSIPSDKNEAQFVFYLSEGRYSYYKGSLNSMLYQTNSVPLTQEEEQTLAVMLEMYNHSVEQYNGAQAYYDVEPAMDSLPLEEGKVNQQVLEAAVEYLNTIRYGAGLPLLTHNQSLSEGAQAKAVYVNYLSSQGVEMSNPHNPPQIEGVSDEFYALCQSGGAENLFWGNVLTSITHALDDSAGDPIYCGHRNALINPAYTDVGLGSSSAGIGQGAHKFFGYQAVDVDAVCWPSDGITPIEGIYSNTFRWTATLYRYTTTADTTVSVTCLNSGESWEFSTEAGNLVRSTSFLSWGDNNLSVSPGDVYTVTISNVNDSQTGSLTDYTYRAVIADLYTEQQEEITSFTLDQSYCVGIPGETIKLQAQITPNGIDNALVHWSSSDPSVAQVSQNGWVTLLQEGNATITATADNGGFIASAAVVVSSYDSLMVTPPDKTSYYLGEELDLTGLEATVFYASGDSRTVADYTVSGYDPNTLGSQTVTVSYGDCVDSFQVTVEQWPITRIGITSSPDTTTYYIGQSLDLTGLEVMAYYQNGSSEAVSGYTVTGFDSSTPGSQTVTISYSGFTASFQVMVQQRTLTRISIAQPAEKTVYDAGQRQIDTTGLVVLAHYNDGTSEEIADYTAEFWFTQTVDGVEYPTPGSNRIRISYGGYSLSYSITVLEQTTPSYDVNQDDATDVLDVMALAQMVVRETGEIPSELDLTQDGVINVLDVMALAQWVMTHA